MDNKIEHFVLKPDGKIYWIQEPAKVPAFASSTGGIGRYKQALQSAISNAIPVVNQEEVKSVIRWGEKKYVDIGVPFPLQCHVEKRVNYHSTKKTLALVTFSEKLDSVQWQDIMTTAAGVEETQEDDAYSELYDLLDYEGREVDQYDYGLPWGDNKDAIINKMKSQFTITRKNK